MKTPELMAIWQRLKTVSLVVVAAFGLFFASDAFFPQSAAAYPFWAQQTAPATPREATGRIVCANCHLAAKEAEVEIPQSVLPNQVFEAVVKIPYDHSNQQVLGDGSKAGLNVGAVLMLPDGFKIAPADRLSEELKEKTSGLYFQSYTADQENVIIIGPVSGDQYEEIVFPILSPDPKTDKNVHYGKYAVHVGANRGRGQIYPTGLLSNNNQFKASAAGTISAIAANKEGGSDVTISSATGDVVVAIPAGPEVTVSVGQAIASGEALTNNPNVGGFGQKDTEVVLQNPARIYGYLAFVAGIMLTQIFLVLKKKQVERVQAGGQLDF